MEPEVSIVGGGLAGMIAALRLCEQGCRVTLFEATDRLGGKAGANRHRAGYDEHGYHIFPAWYLNTRKLASDLSILDHFVDCTDFLQLKKVNGQSEFPRFRTYRNITSWKSAPRNILAGVVPVLDMCLFYYAALDLISQDYSRRAHLDQITISGFLNRRFYNTKNVVMQFEELILKGISVPTYEVSAMTMWRVLSYWVRSPEPMFSILRGNLQEQWIEPIQRRLEELGCIIHIGQHLEKITIEGDRVSSLVFQVTGRQEVRHPVDPVSGRVVMALPVERIAHLVDSDLFSADQNLGNLRYLRSRQMAALNIYFHRRVPGIPKAHVSLVGSQYGLSFIDVSQTWPGYDATVLNLIASNVVPLIDLPEKAVYDALYDDLCGFIPVLNEEAVARIDLQSHAREPLFMNSVGAWTFRPSESDKPELRMKCPKRIVNLYLAGDYCRSAIDLVSMEGALSTGLWAAEAVRQDAGLPQPIRVLEPPTYPSRLWWVLKVLLYPLALTAALGVQIREVVSQRR